MSKSPDSKKEDANPFPSIVERQNHPHKPNISKFVRNWQAADRPFARNNYDGSPAIGVRRNKEWRGGIIFLSLHGTTHWSGSEADDVKPADLATGGLARACARHLRCSLIYSAAKSRECNPYLGPTTLEFHLSQAPRDMVVIDLHGARDGDFDIAIGTHLTVPNPNQVLLITQMQAAAAGLGLLLEINPKEYSAHSSRTLTARALRMGFTASLQIEIAHRFRQPEADPWAAGLLGQFLLQSFAHSAFLRRQWYIGATFNGRFRAGNDLGIVIKQGVGRRSLTAKPEDWPPKVTLGFRLAWWSVFSSVYAPSLPPQQEIIFLGIRYRLRSIFLLTSDGDGPRHLEGRLQILAVCVEAPHLDDTTPSPADQRNHINASEQEAAISLRDSLAETFSSLSMLSHRNGKPSLGTHSLATISDPEIGTLAAAFCHVGKLSVWRMTRAIVAIQPGPSALDYRRSANELNDQRQRLVNLKRLFLTRNTSNDPQWQTAIREARRRYSLADDFADATPLVSILQEQLDAIEKLRSDKRKSIGNKAIIIVTVILLPLTALQATFAINNEATVIKLGVDILDNARVDYVLAGSILLTLLLLLYLLVDYFVFVVASRIFMTKAWRTLSLLGKRYK